MGCLLQRNRRFSSSSSSSSSSVLLHPICLVIFFLLAIFLEKSVGIVSASEYSKDKQATSSLTIERIQKHLDKINKPAVLTIESPDGDTIDCIDQWKQPAFDHPLLKNHKLQLAPSKIPRVRRTEKKEVKWQQLWHQNGTRCPKGTVPIRRITADDVLRAQTRSLHDFGRKQQKMALAALKGRVSPSDVNPFNNEYAVVFSETANVVYGATAAINLWNPTVAAAGETSISQIWVFGGEFDGGDINSVEAGWMVDPQLFGDSKTRLFVYWTADGYHSTGCYNLICPGFVQVDKNIAVGSVPAPVSTISGAQYETILKLWKDPKTGNWWLEYGGNIAMGYWPAELFTHLRENATMVEWGGVVTNTKPNGAHTSTQMGSGRFPQEDYGKASYFRQLGVVLSNNAVSPPTITTTRVDNSNCYNLDLRQANNDWGTHFYYGGPGLNPNCP